MTKVEKIFGAVLAAAFLAATGFVAGRWSTTAWPIVADACVDYGKARAEFMKAEREFEAKHSPYRHPIYAAVFRDFERPDRYLARVSTREAHADYVRQRDDCARQLAAVRR
jgi:hypothetical protein